MIEFLIGVTALSDDLPDELRNAFTCGWNQLEGQLYVYAWTHAGEGE